MPIKRNKNGRWVKPPKSRRTGMAPGKGGIKSKPGSTRGPGIKPATYNKLMDAFFVHQSIQKAADTAGVGWKCAKFYIDGPGKPQNGMGPIRQAYLDVQVEAQEKKQLTLLRFHEEQTKELEEILAVTLAELRLIKAEILERAKEFHDSNGKTIKTGATLGSALKTYERGAKLMERFLGGPDQIHEHSVDDTYANWTDEELVEFMTTGKMPDHAR